MPKLIATSALLAALVVLPSLVRAQDDDYAVAEEVTPESSAPSWTPPPPEETPAPPPQAQAQPQPQPQQQAPPGQWVYTQQYGWLWMPYSDTYTQVPANGWGEPYAYVYYPAYSTWTWVAAPWVWGFGPWPVFGVFGPARFGWYGHGWWRSPSRWHYAPAHAWYPGGGWRAPMYSRGGGGWGAPRFAPSRGGFGVVRAPAVGGHAVRGGGHGGGGGRGGGGRGGGHGRW
jgi:hypothetical protein